jgi:GT2 family glycosyltransferase
VNYGTAPATWRLAESLISQKAASWRCIVVDNGNSTEGRALLDRLPILENRIMIVRPHINLGYFGGARYGLRTWCEAGAEIPEWTIVSNADIRLESTFFENISKVNAETDVAAPSILSELARHDQNPYFAQRPSRYRVKRNYFITSHRAVAQCGHIYGSVIKPRISRAKRTANDGERDIYAAHGSLICFRQSWFNQGGNLNHEPFLYGEEFTIAELAVSIGARISYVPALRAIHGEHKSTGLIFTKQVAAYQAEAARYVRRLLEDTESV